MTLFRQTALIIPGQAREAQQSVKVSVEGGLGGGGVSEEPSKPQSSSCVQSGCRWLSSSEGGGAKGLRTDSLGVEQNAPAWSRWRWRNSDDSSSAEFAAEVQAKSEYRM